MSENFLFAKIIYIFTYQHLKIMTDIHKKVEVALMYGKPILADLMKLTDNELKEELFSILDGQDFEYASILHNKPDITRTIKNGEPEKIELWFWDGIIIDCFGIKYKPKHDTEKCFIKFNRHFKL
jgi:hypothetical protein